MPIEILVVDDDKATRQWLCSVLDAEGYVCHAARNTQEAEDILHRTEVQLALVDIYLGEANGVEFLQRIKAIQSGLRLRDDDGPRQRGDDGQVGEGWRGRISGEAAAH